MKTTRVLTLGGGLGRDANGAVRLTRRSRQRVRRTIRYYRANRRRFATDPDAWILCSGGYPGLSEGWPAPPEGLREATLMRDALIRAGVPAELIRTEDGSWSTVSNLANCIALGLITPGSFTAGRPLGIVTHPYHMRRAIRLAALCGLTAVQPIPTKQRDGYVRETAIRALTTFGVRNLAAAERRERLLAGVRRLVRRRPAVPDGSAAFRVP